MKVVGNRFVVYNIRVKLLAASSRSVTERGWEYQVVRNLRTFTEM